MNEIISKIVKLLNLAGNNPNENEAYSAFLKAHELLKRYNVSERDFEDISYDHNTYWGSAGPDCSIMQGEPA